MRDSYLKAHLNISVQAEVFIGRERGSRIKRAREDVGKFCTCRPAQSVQIRW